MHCHVYNDDNDGDEDDDNGNVGDSCASMTTVC
jgi:hypothetical protein